MPLLYTIRLRFEWEDPASLKTQEKHAKAYMRRALKKVFEEGLGGGRISKNPTVYNTVGSCSLHKEVISLILGLDLLRPALTGSALVNVEPTDAKEQNNTRKCIRIAQRKVRHIPTIIT
jgi:hypothetical protein